MSWDGKARSFDAVGNVVALRASTFSFIALKCAYMQLSFQLPSIVHYAYSPQRQLGVSLDENDEAHPLLSRPAYEP
jgi:hypothetical protein